MGARLASGLAKTNETPLKCYYSKQGQAKDQANNEHSRLQMDHLHASSNGPYLHLSPTTNGLMAPRSSARTERTRPVRNGVPHNRDVKHSRRQRPWCFVRHQHLLLDGRTQADYDRWTLRNLETSRSIERSGCSSDTALIDMKKMTACAACKMWVSGVGVGVGNKGEWFCLGCHSD